MNNKKEKKLDEIMKKALASDMKPEDVLNQRILHQWKENPDMNKKRRVPLAAAAAMCILLLSVTVGAAVKYLKPYEIARESQMKGVEGAFKGKDAIEINESKEAGEYRITLLGIAKGDALIKSDLSETMPDVKSTYAAVAIERLDGRPMPSPGDGGYGQLSFFISPLVEGLKPWQYNIASMNGGYSDVTVHGIFYRIIECNDIEKFADRSLYLSISDTVFFDIDAYEYDEETGAISRKKGYKGINLLFDLPMDPAKADPAAAKEYLKNLEKSWESSRDEQDDPDDPDDPVKSIEDKAKQLDVILKEGRESGNMKKALGDAVLDKKSKQTLAIQGDHYEYEDAEGISYFYKENFVNGIDYMISYSDYNEKTQQFESLSITIVKENGDGTAVAETYKQTL